MGHRLLHSIVNCTTNSQEMKLLLLIATMALFCASNADVVAPKDTAAPAIASKDAVTKDVAAATVINAVVKADSSKLHELKSLAPDDDHKLQDDRRRYNRYRYSASPYVIRAVHYRKLYRRCQRHWKTVRRCPYNLRTHQRTYNYLLRKSRRAIYLANIWIRKYNSCVRYCWWRKDRQFRRYGDSQQSNLSKQLPDQPVKLEPKPKFDDKVVKK